MEEAGDFPELKKKSKKVTMSVMYSHPAGKSYVAVTEEDGLEFRVFNCLSSTLTF